MKVNTLILNEERKVSLTYYLLDNNKNELQNAMERPAILIMPGGGYIGCSDREAEPVAVAFLAEGFNVFVLRYSTRLNAVWPNPLNDAEEAMEIIRANHKEWGITPNKIAAVGFSAGGHLAAALGTMGKNKPNAMILGYPVILQEMVSRCNSTMPGLDDKVAEDTPPTFLFATRTDETVSVKNTIRFLEALDDMNIPFESHIFSQGVHGLSLAKSHTSMGLELFVNDDVAQWFPMSIRWLKKVWGGFDNNMEEPKWTSFNDDTEKYSVENSLRKLLSNSDVRLLVLSYIPGLEKFEKEGGDLGISAMDAPIVLNIPFVKGTMNDLEKELKKI